MATPGFVLKFNAVKQVVAQHRQKFDDIKPPRDVYHENRAVVKAGIAQTWAHMTANPDPSDMSRVQKIVEFGGRLKEMEMKHKASIDDDDKDFQTTLETAMESLCDDLVNVLGVDMVTRSLHKIPKRYTHNPRSDETQSAPGVEGPDHMPKGHRHDVQKISKSRKRRRIDESQTGDRERRSSVNVTTVRYSLAKAPKRTGHQNSQGISAKEQNSSSIPEPVGVQTRQSRARVNQEDAEAIIDPTPGHLYFAFRKKSKEWSAALLLPKSDLEDFGIPNTLEQLGLMDDIPQCYVYNKDTNTFRWRKGYREGQPMFKHRQFPVMFFDGLPFPAKSEVAWISTKDMRPLDITVTHSSLIPHHQSVFKYMKERAAIAAQESMESVSGDGNQDGLLDDTQTRHPSPVGLGIDSGSSNHSPPGKLDDPSEPPVQPPPSAPLPVSPTRSLEAIQTTHNSPALDPEISINDQTGSGPEIISVTSSPIEPISHLTENFPVEELTDEEVEETPAELRHFKGDRSNEEVHWTKTPSVEMGSTYDACEITSIHAPATLPRRKVPRKKARTAEASPTKDTPEITRQTDSHQYKEVIHPEMEQQPTQRRLEPVPGALLATLTAWTKLAHSRSSAYAPAEPSPRHEEFSPTRNIVRQTHEPQYPVSQQFRRLSEPNTSSSFSFGLPAPVPSATSRSYPPNLLDRTPSNPLPSISTFATVPSLLDESAEICRLPPIASSRRLNGAAWSIPSLEWPSSGLRSQAQSQDDHIDLDRSPLFPAANAPFLGNTHQNSAQFAMMAFSSPPGEASMTSSAPEMSPRLGPSIPIGIYPWPERISRPVIQRLEAYIRHNNLPPGLQGMINYQGLYLCPLCDQSKRKGYIRVATFVNHLQRKH